jgi:hypothetical protein
MLSPCHAVPSPVPAARSCSGSFLPCRQAARAQARAAAGADLAPAVASGALAASTATHAHAQRMPLTMDQIRAEMASENQLLMDQVLHTHKVPLSLAPRRPSKAVC